MLYRIEVNGRDAIFLSVYDVTTGLAGTPTFGCLGYTPKWSMRIAANVALYALAGRLPADSDAAPSSD